MNSITLALVIFGIMLVFMAVRVPISIAMFFAGAVGYIMQAGWGPFSNFLNTQAFARFASYDLSVIPLFILMGHFATQGGISRALFRFAAAARNPVRRGPSGRNRSGRRPSRIEGFYLHRCALRGQRRVFHASPSSSRCWCRVPRVRRRGA